MQYLLNKTNFEALVYFSEILSYFCSFSSDILNTQFSDILIPLHSEVNHVMHFDDRHRLV